mmetsp:Transcript_9017/g.25267  ORF Transcript_9017/g.25267 Transcript_9017/m.25267 type:complete len:275 (-) Transcript_9017:64-888(-)
MAQRKCVAVVTGSNQGIGFEIVKGLLGKLPQNAVLVLTSRDVGRGEEAVKKLGGVGERLSFHQLDITDELSVKQLRDDLDKEHGGIDILVNNAGFAYKGSSSAPFSEQARVTNDVNYYGTLRVSEALLPMVRANGRVVNVGSMAGSVKKCSEDLQRRFLNPDLTVEELSGLVEDFVRLARNGEHQNNGWPNTAYGVSKIAVHALTRIQARELAQRMNGSSAVAVCPGWCKTNMAGFDRPPRTAEKGAETPIAMALWPDDTANAKFYTDLKEREW